MTTPKQLTQMAYDMGVAGVDLNTLTFAVVDAMEASSEYYGPYDPEQRNFLEKYLIEEITPDRIDYCRYWLANYQSPILSPLVLSNSIFYAGDGPNTPIGIISGFKAGSTISVLADSRVLINGVNVFIGEAQSSPTTFAVTFRESWYGIVTRDTTFNFSAIPSPYIVSGAIQPPFMGSTGQVFSPRILYNQVVLPAFISANSIVASPTVIRGAVNVSPPPIGATTSVFSPTVTQAAGYDPDADAYFSASGTTDPTRKGLYNDMVVGIKADGDWSGLDWLCVAGSTSLAMRTNIRVPSKVASAVNSPVFTVDRGFTGDGSTSYLDLGEMANAAGNNYSLNSAMLMGYTNQESGTAGVRALMGNVSTQRASLSARNSAGNLTFRANDQTDSTGATGQTSRIGFRAWARSTSTDKRFYVESTETANLSVSTTSVSTGNLCVLRDVAAYSNDRVAAFVSGSGVSAAAIGRLQSRILTYLTAIGAN